MDLSLKKILNLFNIKKKLNTKALQAAIKLEKESMDLNNKSETYLQNAQEIEKEWRKKWIKWSNPYHLKIIDNIQNINLLDEIKKVIMIVFSLF